MIRGQGNSIETDLLRVAYVLVDIPCPLQPERAVAAADDLGPSWLSAAVSLRNLERRETHGPKNFDRRRGYRDRSPEEG